VKKKSVISVALLTAVIAAGCLLYFTHARSLEKAAAAAAPSPAVSIVAGVVAQHDVPIYLSGVGTVIAYNTDVVRAQIQGQIISINFTEGQTVHAGDLLAQIDPRPYQALIDQFTGNLERDRAQLIMLSASRSFTALGRRAGPLAVLETQKAQVGQLQAAIKADQALIDAAKCNSASRAWRASMASGIRQIDRQYRQLHLSTPPSSSLNQIVSLIFTLPETVHRDQQQQQRPRLRSRFLHSQDDTTLLVKRARPGQQRDPADTGSIQQRRILSTKRIDSGLANSSTRGCWLIQGTMA
jgi:multidrug efflux system membrane fusion protein